MSTPHLLQRNHNGFLNLYKYNRSNHSPLHQLTQHHNVNSIHINVANSNNISLDETDNKTTDHCQAQQMPILIYEMFSNEENRLKTFDKWPLDFLDKGILAKSGMYYTGDVDKVKCYFCEVEIGHWELTDEPVSEHIRWSPNCPLLRRRTTNNVPISAEELDQILPQMSYDICGANDVASIDMRTNAYAEGTITSPYYPEYPEYAIEAARLRSFNEWPRNMKQKPEQLAEAGFFYIGVGDRVKCFSCGGGLKDWDDTDEPWEQHALWLKKCNYLKLIKGESYIDAVIAKHKAKEAGNELNIEDNNQEDADLETATAAAAAGTTISATAIATATATATAVATTNIAKQLTNGETQTERNATTTTEVAAATTEVAAAATASSTIETLVATTTQQQQQQQQNILHFDSSNKITNATATKGADIAEDAKMCKICYADEYNTAFLPCGHVVACAKCALSVTKCPLCRKPFTNVMRVYFS